MVELVEQNFDKNKKIYENIEKKLKTKIKIEVPITHVGSTAIPNMYGKNIIDILIGAKDKKQFNERRKQENKQMMHRKSLISNNQINAQPVYEQRTS